MLSSGGDRTQDAGATHCPSGESADLPTAYEAGSRALTALKSEEGEVFKGKEGSLEEGNCSWAEKG